MCQPEYESKLIFNDVRIKAAAVYCSDGRFGEMMDDFVMYHLRLPRYDRLSVPGGAAALAGHFATPHEQEAELEQLRFLAEVHKLERVILIAHQGCAYYSERLKVASADLKAQQLEDLRKASARVGALAPGLEVEAFFAGFDEHRVTFERC